MIISELFSRLGLQVDSTSWNKGNALVTGLKGALFGLAAAFSIHEIGEFIHGVAEAADQASKTAETLGITTEAVQELGYAAKLADVSQEELNISLVHLSRGLADVAKGQGPAADGFRALHITGAQLKGLSLDQILELMADGFTKVHGTGVKAQIATDIFGRAGAKLIPLLDAGKGGIEALRKEADSLGIVVSGKTGKAFEEFNDNQTRLAETWRGIKTQIVTALLPGLSSLVDGTIAWVKANRDLINTAVTGFIKGAIVVVKGLAVAFAYVVNVIAFLSDHSEILIGVLSVLAGWFIAVKLAAAAAWLAALGPLDLLLVGIAAVIAGITYMVKHWEKFKPAVDRVKNAIADFGAWILDIPNKITSAFGKAWQAIKDAASAAFDWIANLPGIKQLIAVYKFFAGGNYDPKLLQGGGLTGELDKKYGTDWHKYMPSWQQGSGDASAKSALLPGGATSAPGGAAVFNTPITVQAAPGMDEKGLADLVGAKVKDVHEGLMQDAFSTLRGGYR